MPSLPAQQATSKQFGASLSAYLLSSTIGGTRCPQRVGKANAA